MLNLTLSDIIILFQRYEIWNSIPENNGALKHCLCIFQVHQNSFLQHAATHLDEQQLLPSSCVFLRVLFNFDLIYLKWIFSENCEATDEQELFPNILRRFVMPTLLWILQPRAKTWCKVWFIPMVHVPVYIAY